jgi:hypothetical protein
MAREDHSDTPILPDVSRETQAQNHDFLLQRRDEGSPIRARARARRVMGQGQGRGGRLLSPQKFPARIASTYVCTIAPPSSHTTTTTAPGPCPPHARRERTLLEAEGVGDWGYPCPLRFSLALSWSRAFLLPCLFSSVPYDSPCNPCKERS